MTLAISFLVISLPHLFPCPVPGKQLADTAGRRTGEQRRTRVGQDPIDREVGMPGQALKTSRRRDLRDEDGSESIGSTSLDAGLDARSERECPVPKPGGWLGEVMGWNARKREEVEKKRQIVRIGLRDVGDLEGKQEEDARRRPRTGR